MSQNRDERETSSPSGASLPSAPSAVDARAQRAFERIAGDAALTGALTDDDARLLLQWAKAEIRDLVAATQDMADDEADAHISDELQALRGELRTIARQSARADSPTTAIKAQLSARARSNGRARSNERARSNGRSAPTDADRVVTNKPATDSTEDTSHL